MSESTSGKGFPEQPNDFFQDIIAQKPPHEHRQFQATIFLRECEREYHRHRSDVVPKQCLEAFPLSYFPKLGGKCREQRNYFFHLPTCCKGMRQSFPQKNQRNAR